MYLEQRFTRGGDEAARAVVKAALTGPEGRVLPQQLVDASPWRLDSARMPEGVRRRVEAEAAIRADVPRREHEPIG
ncbi:MAG TPA: hypothetical protein VHG08_11410 [Longimicrobium sp.]|nr:hypothetical protein [Longimicrobium sp.]